MPQGGLYSRTMAYKKLMQRYQYKLCEKRFDDLSEKLLSEPNQPIAVWVSQDKFPLYLIFFELIHNVKTRQCSTFNVVEKALKPK